MNLKKILKGKHWQLAIFLIFPFWGSFAQTGYITELRHSANVPNSPESDAFMQYGNIDVSLYTGKPNIGVPLCTFEGREMNLPMSLTYDASGIKVQQMATQAGMGWNFVLGGRISRVVNGAPDDFLSATPSYLTFRDNAPIAPYALLETHTVGERIQEYIENNNTFETEGGARQYLDFLRDVNDGLIDTQLDFFSMNVFGINETFVFDLATGVPTPLNNPRIKVEAFFDGSSLDSWKVVAEDGTEFFFEEKEMTRTEDNDWGGRADETATLYGIIKEYNSSWLLTKVVSANEKDEYSFNYTGFGLWTQEGPSEPAVSETLSPNNNNGRYDVFPIGTGSQVRFSRKYHIDQHFLSTVYHNSTKIVDITNKARPDHQLNSALSEIKVYNGTGDTTPIKWIKFIHSHFGIGDTYYDVRLKLDEVQFLDELGTDIGNNYNFTYNDPEDVPSRNSLARDYMGYFNNQNSNTVLYPRMEIHGDLYQGANREADFTFASKGIMTRITYPTKGYTQFDYGPAGIITEPVTSTRNVVLGFHSLRGGQGPLDSEECGSQTGPGCFDDFSGNIPKISHKVIRINQSGIYQVGLVNTYNRQSNTTHRGVAYLAKLPNDNQLNFEGVVYGSGDIRAFRIAETAPNGEEVAQSVYLEEGHYQITLANNDPMGTSAIRVYRQESVVTQQETGEYAGIRIEKVRNYTGEGQFANATEYHYVNDLVTRESSHKVVFQPTLIYNRDRTDPDGVVTRFVTRVSSSDGGSQPHIAYEKVIVANTGTDTPNKGTIFPLGYTEHEFTVGRTGLQSPGAPPNISSYFTVDPRVGKPTLSKGVNDKGVWKSETANEYVNLVFYTQQSLYTVHNEELYFHYSMISQDEQGNYRITKVGAEQWCLAPPGEAQNFYRYCENNNEPIRPSICNEPGNTCYGIPEMASLEIRLNAMTGQCIKTGSTETRTRSTDDSETGTYTERMAYDYTGPGFLPRSITRFSSTGSRIERRTYPQDRQGTVFQEMVSDNQLSRIVSSTAEEFTVGDIDGTLVRQVANYGKVGNGFYTTNVEIRQKDGPLEDRVHYLYDGQGNMVQQYHMDGEGVSTTYLWGYDGRQIIAEVTNATYEQVENALGAATVLNLRDNYFTDEQLRSQLAPLRSMDGAFATIYTHRLGRGITSVTDPNGQVQYFHYDTAGRLETVKDHDGNVVQQTEYNYRSN